MLLISVRKKHLTFWLVLLIASAGLWVSYNRIRADVVPVSFFKTRGGELKQRLIITSQAQAKLGDKDISSAFQPAAQNQTDTFFYKFLDKPGVSYNKLELTIILPDNLPAKEVKVDPILTYTQVPKAFVKKYNHQIIISGYNLGPQTLFSLHMFIPKGYLSFPWYQSAWQFIKNEKLSFWLGISILLPFISLMSFFIITNQQRHLKKKLETVTQINQPPSQLNPALVDILYHNRVTAKAITSTLLNLANRGLIEIVFKDNQFLFGRLGLKSKQAQGTASLEPAEKVILSKLFRGNKFKAEEGEIRFRVAHRLFSGKIALFYYLLYHQAFEKNFFIQEPAGVHRHYRNWGLAIFFIGIGGLVINLFLFSTSMAILWLAMVVAGVLFIHFSSRISFLNEKGLKELRGWLAFRKFLTSHQPVTKKANKDLFFNYLPYAVALDCEKEWLARFQNQAITLPAWYMNLNSPTAGQNFGDNLFSLLKWLSESLSYAKDPAVE